MKRKMNQRRRRKKWRMRLKQYDISKNYETDYYSHIRMMIPLVIGLTLPTLPVHQLVLITRQWIPEGYQCGRR